MRLPAFCSARQGSTHGDGLLRRTAKRRARGGGAGGARPAAFAVRELPWTVLGNELQRAPPGASPSSSTDELPLMQTWTG